MLIWNRSRLQLCAVPHNSHITMRRLSMHTHSLVAYRVVSAFLGPGYAGFCNSDSALRPHVEIKNYELKMYQWILNQSITDMSYQCHSEYKMLFGERGNMDIRLFSGQFVDITNPLLVIQPFKYSYPCCWELVYFWEGIIHSRVSSLSGACAVTYRASPEYGLISIFHSVKNAYFITPHSQPKSRIAKWSLFVPRPLRRVGLSLRE